MPHVELSISEASPTDPGESTLTRWAVAVATAEEPCLVLDADKMIVAASVSCGELIGLGDPDAAAGLPLREAVGHLVDFTSERQALDDSEVGKIPPLLAITSGHLARGLIRVSSPRHDATTLDAIATPLFAGDTVVGSLTFFLRISRP